MQNEPMTLDQIAESEGVSHQRIAQILASAISKVRKALAAKGIDIKDLL